MGFFQVQFAKNCKKRLSDFIFLGDNAKWGQTPGHCIHVLGHFLQSGQSEIRFSPILIQDSCNYVYDEAFPCTVLEVHCQIYRQGVRNDNGTDPEETRDCRITVLFVLVHCDAQNMFSSKGTSSASTRHPSKIHGARCMIYSRTRDICFSWTQIGAVELSDGDLLIGKVKWPTVLVHLSWSHVDVIKGLLGTGDV